jgi:DnaJ-class molecular chaperone
VTHILIVLALLAGYALFLLIRPMKACRSCSGWGAKGRRRSYCTRCSGTGRRFRLGASLVHRGAAAAYRYARTRKEAGR